LRLGNDIVDRSATQGHNPRFIDRILHPKEKARRTDWSLNDSVLWLYWACKEAAYKAIRQSRDIPFHHREFIVSEDFTSLAWHGDILQLSTRLEDDAIFAVATDGDPRCCHSQIAAFATEADPATQSEKARDLLLVLAEVHLALPRRELTIITENRIPKIQHKTQVLSYAMSLTHHGRYVAASLAVP
jgi:phosphopantetheinyl transferase (holo-ACP synthase)